MIRTKTQVAVLLAVTTFAATSWGDEFHYNNILVGDRASGMGGAYAAVSDDPGGMYYNPAGIAYSTGKNLSASVNAYSVSNKTYKGVFAGQDWTRTSSTLLPNFFGIIQPVGKIKLGFSYAVPDSNQEDQDQSFSYDNGASWGNTTHVINFNNKNDVNLFGPSAAIQLSDSFSVGATLYAHTRNTEAILNWVQQSDDGKSHNWVNSYRETNELGVKPIVGIMWSPAEKISLGLTVSKTVILRSEILDQANQSAAENQTSGATNNANIVLQTNKSLNTTSQKRSYPYQVTAGVAFFPNSSLLISGDLSYYSAYDYEWVDGLTKRTSVINGALGAEYYINKNWAVRGGLFTDIANTPDLVSDGTYQLEHIDMYGGSMTVSHFTKNTSISCGGSYKFGNGKSQIMPTSPVQDVTANNWTLFISSSYTY